MAVSLLAQERIFTPKEIQKARVEAEAQLAERKRAEEELKKSEKGLAEAQRLAHLGNWEWDIKTDKIYWSDETYRIFGLKPQESAPNYNGFLSHVHPEDRNKVSNALKKSLNSKSFSINYRIVLPKKEERTVHMQSEVVFNEKNTPVRIKGIIQDITKKEDRRSSGTDGENPHKEIHHRIKNNLQVISSLLDLQA